MSAAREELEAEVNRQLTRAWKYGFEPGGPGSNRERPVDAILAAADKYADAARGEAISRMTGAAAARLAQAAAEAERVKAS